MTKKRINNAGDYDLENSWLDRKQYDMLKRCSENKDLTEWNEWRKNNPNEDIQLRGACFKGFFLEGVNFIKASVRYEEDEVVNYTGEVHLEKANFESAHLDRAWFANAVLKNSVFQYAVGNADFHGANLEEANLSVAKLQGSHFNDAILINTLIAASHLEGVTFTEAKLMGCQVRYCIVDNKTQFLRIAVNKYSKNKTYTDFSGTFLGSTRIDSGTRQLLDYNIRRMNWDQWYKKRKSSRFIMAPFLWLSDYGFSAKRVLFCFFLSALFFAGIYSCLSWINPPGVIDSLAIEPHQPFWHYLFLGIIRPIYFSIVTMTTLGFGDMYAYSQSILGHLLLTIQVLLGYILLGALITRFAILFTSDGPPGDFTSMEEEKRK